MMHLSGWGPDKKKGAISITFDNLGAVAERTLGMPQVMGKSGQHLSIEVLPRALDIVQGIKITYFIEAWNCFEHPDVIKDVGNAGHEIGVHAWKHENWAGLSKEERRAVMRQSVDAFRNKGIDVQGFRPPGGRSPVDELLIDCASCGLKYASFLGELGDYRQGQGVVGLPFIWHHVDAYMLHPDLGELRKTYGDQQEAFAAEDWESEVERALNTAKQKGIHVTLIFHPSMLGRDERFLEILASCVRSVQEDGDLWLAPLGAAAAFLDMHRVS